MGTSRKLVVVGFALLILLGAALEAFQPRAWTRFWLCGALVAFMFWHRLEKRG